MGLSRFLFDNEWAQRMDIDDTRRRVEFTASRERLARRETRERIAELETDVGMLALACRTTIRLLVEKGTVTREEFVAAMKAIDLQDGTEDGQYTGPLDAP